MKKRNLAAIFLGVTATAGIGGSVFFYRRAMKRGKKTKMKRTMRLAGMDWSKYEDFIAGRKENLLAQPKEDVYVVSEDGLTLHANYFPQGEEKKIVVCFHGYSSESMKEYLAISDYYLKKGYSLLLVDERAHGESDGEYIGFGCLDRQDALCWLDWLIGNCGEDVEILMHGTSMGGSTVLMASGLELPPQVKGIISDCGFTSAGDILAHVMRTIYHLPAYPVIPITNVINKFRAGYGINECNAACEVRKATVPILMIHGDADTFVPLSMCEKIYENIASPKQKLIVEGAGHIESYYKDTAAYEQALDRFIASLEEYY